MCLLVLVYIVQAAADLLQRLSDRSKEQSLNHRLRRLTERTCAVVREATVLRHDTGLYRETIFKLYRTLTFIIPAVFLWFVRAHIEAASCQRQIRVTRTGESHPALAVRWHYLNYGCNGVETRF